MWHYATFETKESHDVDIQNIENTDHRMHDDMREVKQDIKILLQRIPPPEEE